jgi:hypothetical protein
MISLQIKKAADLAAFNGGKRGTATCAENQSITFPYAKIVRKRNFLGGFRRDGRRRIFAF